MYKQTIQNIEVAVLSLDGFILDLNRMRFNYYKHLCKEHNVQISKEEFHHHLSNMYDMYNNLPLHNIYQSGILNAKIERELFHYLEYTGVNVREGVYELIEYFHQKNIKIAVVSTHHTKNAVDYLKLANLYNKIHFIIGSDSKCIPLPSNQTLEAIRNHFKVETHHVLVVSPFDALQKSAYSLKMNIIHCEDLIKSNEEDKKICYKCVPDAFEVLNTLLFDKYAEENMYSSILGMDESMSKNELEETYNYLNEKFADDKDVLDIVDQTYQYHISQINDHHIKDGSVILTTKRRFVFDEDENTDEDLYHINHKETASEKKKNETINDILELAREEEKKQLIDDIIETTKEENVSHVKQLNKDEEDELATLLKQIQKKEKPEKQENIEQIPDLSLNLDKDETDEISQDEEETTNLFMFVIYELISAMLSSLTILFVGIVIAVLFIHQWGKGGLIGIIESMYNSYCFVVTTVFSFIFDTLHHFISLVPSYLTYVNENALVSSQGIEFLNIFIFNTFIIFIVRLIIVLKRRIDNDRKN